MSQDPLDEALKRHLPALPRPKALPKRLERVYDGMGDRLAMRHHLDRYDEVSGGPSARGIDDELLRRMASYLLSLAEGRWRRLAKSIPALWKRGGREHRKIAGMLVANLPEEALGDERWTVFSMLLQNDVGLAPVVDAAEEIRRASGQGPSEAWLLAMAAQALENMPKHVTDLRVNALIPDIGHWTQQEAAEATNEYLLDWLAGLD